MTTRSSRESSIVLNDNTNCRFQRASLVAKILCNVKEQINHGVIGDRVQNKRSTRTLRMHVRTCVCVCVCVCRRKTHVDIVLNLRSRVHEVVCDGIEK